MDRMDSVARRLDRSLTRDVVFAVAGPIALGTALGMLMVSWSSYGGAVAARPAIERGPLADECDDDDAADDEADEAADDDDDDLAADVVNIDSDRALTANSNKTGSCGVL